MKRTMIWGGLALLLAAGAEARDWGFDVDTVYGPGEYGPGVAPPSGRKDSVFVINNGADTLRLDSVFASDVETYWTGIVFQYGRSPINTEYTLYRGGGGKKFLASAVIAPGAAVKLSGFDIGGEQGRTLIARLRFKSTAGESDSLIVKGRNNSLSIKPFGLYPIFFEGPGRAYDIRGRKAVYPRYSPVWNISPK